ncbi:MAG: hypothetical protein QOF65_1969 [Thermoleophilaceae bacterium]|jgi:hypothetical protein|nr:hypothetical protein [Thermoleophilaceae bacterium]MEA2437413.1 hypothetical protein [Thermoleophilaceae bacterium]
MSEIRYMPIRVLVLAALMLMAALLPAAPAGASTTQASILQDDPHLIYTTTSANREKRLDELQSLGIDIVKVRVNWRVLAPSRRPSGYNGADPTAYGDRWTPYDELVAGAEARGLGVLFQVGGSAPEWATPGNSAIRNPNPAEFGKFVEAVGARYPSVHMYSVWNEPNLVSWLSPQVSGGVPQSPRIYRGLLSAAAGGLQRSGHTSDQLLVGELLPFSRSSNDSTKKIRPIAFLRELACVDSHYKPYGGNAARKRGCKGFKSLPGTGLAYHPYTLSGGPKVKTPNKDDASIGDLGRLNSAINKLRARHRIGSYWPIWITEFGFQSDPPDPYGSPIKKIPAYMGEAEYLAFKNSRVRSFAQYPLIDDQGHVAGFQSGLRFSNGKPKPYVFAAFQRPFFARQLGSRVELFGGVRAASSGSVTIQTRTSTKAKWSTLRDASLNTRGYFDVIVKVSKISKRYFRFIGSGQPASRTAKAVKR